MAESNPDHQLGQYIPLHYHFNMLQDTLRMEGFRNAIGQRVKPGMQVVELGGGTGVLSFFAAQAGGRVQCVERNPLLVKTSRALLERNGVSQQVEVIQADAEEWLPNHPVDIVICEMLHVGLLREKQLQVISAFKEGHLRRFGNCPQFIPEASILMVQAVQQDFGFCGYQAPVPVFQLLQTEHESTTRSLSDLEPYSSIIYDEEFSPDLRLESQQTVVSEGEFNAVRFVTQNALAIDETNGTAVLWPNHALILPTPAPGFVVAGDKVNLRFHYRAGDEILTIQESLTTRTVPNPSVSPIPQQPPTRRAA